MALDGLAAFSTRDDGVCKVESGIAVIADSDTFEGSAFISMNYFATGLTEADGTGFLDTNDTCNGVHYSSFRRVCSTLWRSGMRCKALTRFALCWGTNPKVGAP